MVMRINDHYIHIYHHATLCPKRCLEQRSPRCLPLHFVIGDLDCWAPASYKVAKVKTVSNITISHNRLLGLGPSILQSCKSEEEKKPQKIANAVQVTLWLSVTNPQGHDKSSQCSEVKCKMSEKLVKITDRVLDGWALGQL